MQFSRLERRQVLIPGPVSKYEGVVGNPARAVEEGSLIYVIMTIITATKIIILVSRDFLSEVLFFICNSYQVSLKVFYFPAREGLGDVYEVIARIL